MATKGVKDIELMSHFFLFECPNSNRALSYEMTKNSERLIPRTPGRPTASLRSVPAAKITSQTKATLEDGLILTRQFDLLLISPI